MRTRLPRLAVGTLLNGMLLVTLVGPPVAAANSDLPPARRTGAPNENTCATCHDGGLNDGVGTLSMEGVPAFYTPGQAYTISVTLTRSGSSRWGFELTSLKSSDGTAAGTLANTTPLTYIQTSSGKLYVSHTTLNNPSDGTFSGTVGGPVTWSFQWTAPPAGSGGVIFYAAGVAADGSDDADAGDFVYTASKPSAEEIPSAVEMTTWGKIKMRYR